MKAALIGILLTGLVPASAMASDRYDRGHDRSRVGISLNVGSGSHHSPSRHYDRHADRHRPVIVERHHDGVVYEDYYDDHHRPVYRSHHSRHHDSGHH